MKRSALICLSILMPPVFAWRAPAQAPPGNVYVVLWFDTEDYILPQSDDAAKRLATFLTDHGIQATFKVVGEKARVLERRNRHDVIEALKRHAIGFHANTHSQHPTPAEYESQADWERGAEEFTRRERPGFDDVKRIFGKKPCCYGQPGNSWAPQAFPALAEWGVKLYLDEAPHVGLDGQPFYYGGLLNIFNTREGPQLRPNDDWSNLDQSKEKFRQFYELMSNSGGGLISLYFHPCEFIHSQFWDLNFANGANPPRDQWRIFPLRPQASQERAFNYFEQLVLFMKSFPEVQFITGPQAIELYSDRAQGKSFSDSDIDEIARSVGTEVSFQQHDDYCLSPAEILLLLTKYADDQLQHRPHTGVQLTSRLYGPSMATAELQAPVRVTWNQFVRTVADVDSALEHSRQIPDVIWFGSQPVPPEAYVWALANSVGAIARGKYPESVVIAPAHLTTQKYVAKDSPELWAWPIFPTGFHSEHLMELARLQAWTLKPAFRHEH